MGEEQKRTAGWFVIVEQSRIAKAIEWLKTKNIEYQDGVITDLFGTVYHIKFGSEYKCESNQFRRLFGMN